MIFLSKHAICCDEPIIHFEIHSLGELKLQHFLLHIVFTTKNNVDLKKNDNLSALQSLLLLEPFDENGHLSLPTSLLVPASD